MPAIGAHALRATAVTNALDHRRHRQGPGMAEASQYRTTRVYDRLKKPEDSPTFEVSY
jgi:integrase/recombinase XerD